jgi:hypothetical protein
MGEPPVLGVVFTLKDMRNPLLLHHLPSREIPVRLFMKTCERSDMAVFVFPV